VSTTSEVVATARPPAGLAGRISVVLLCTAGIALLTLIVGSLPTAWSRPYVGLDWSWARGEVTEVDKAGPAEAAGLRQGDRIIAVGENPGVAGLAGITAGRPVSLAIRRAGRLQEITLVPASPTAWQRLGRLEPLLIALCYALLGFLVWARWPYRTQTVLFLLVCLLGAAVLTFGILATVALLWAVRGFLVAFLFLSPLLIHFHLHFLHRRRLPGGRLILGGLYGLALALAVPMGCCGSFLGHPWILLARTGARLFFAVASAVTLGLLLWAYRTSSPAHRRRIRLVAFGTLLAFAPLILLAVLPEALTGTPRLPYELTFPFLLLIPLAYAYAIAKEDLFHIDRLVNRGVVYLMLTLLLALPALGLATALSRLAPAGWQGHPLIWTLFALLVGVAFAPLRTRLQALADRLFYGGWYDYRTVVEEISRGLSRVDDEETLAAQLVDRLRARIPVGCACLWLVEAGAWRQVRGAGCPMSAVGRPPDRIAAAREPMAAAGEGDCPETVLWVPLRHHGQLRGALALGPKAGGEPFGDGDLCLLTAVGRQAAVAAENVRLVTTLRQRAEEIDRLHQQLLTSREEERKRLARELHDQIIQDLLALSYSRPGVQFLEEAPTQTWAVPRAYFQQILDNLRQICYELRPSTLDDLGLIASIADFAGEFGEQHRLPIHLALPPSESDNGLPEEIILTLFRTLQEALRNVVRHAEARQAWVTLEIRQEAGNPSPTPTEIVLTVRDDGQGFVVPRRLGLLTADGHFGLAGLKERLAMVEGTLTVHSTPGRGTAVVATAPLSQSPEPKPLCGTSGH